MKSEFTQNTYDYLLLIRQSLGGGGYTAWSALPRLIEDFSPQVTFEGDNTVMAQQSAMYIFKAAKRAYKGKGVADEPLEYLEFISVLSKRKCQAKTPEDFLTLKVVN
jgi:acyl-CoA oxidase